MNINREDEIVRWVEQIVSLHDESMKLIEKESNLYDEGKIKESEAVSQEVENNWLEFDQAISDLIHIYKRLYEKT